MCRLLTEVYYNQCLMGKEQRNIQKEKSGLNKGGKK